MKYRPTADECAILLATAMNRNAEQASKAITRARLTEKSMRRVCGRRMLRGVFLDELATSLLDRQLVLMQGSRYFGLIRESSLEGWTRVTSTTIAGELLRLRDGDEVERKNVLDELDNGLDDETGDEDE